MKKVLFINNIVYPVYDILLSELQKEKNLDLNFMVLSGDKKGEWGYAQKFKGKIIYLYSWIIKLPAGFNQLSLYINPSILFHLLNINPDIIVISGWDQISYLLAFCYAKLTGKTIILWSASTENEISTLRTITRPLIKFIIKHCDRIIAFGTKSKEYLLAMRAEEAKIILGYYCCEPIFGENDKHVTYNIKQKARKKLRIADKLTLLYVGQLIKRKGVDLLIEAFRKLDNDDVQLVICGDGELKGELLKIANNRNIIFLGAKKREELEDAYLSADVFVLPSYEEVWGLVVNEAMSMGLPVIVSDSAGCAADLVVERVNGFTFQSANYDDLTSKIRYFADNPVKIEKMGKESLKIIKNFIPAILSASFLKAFEVK